jgi:heme oxygenase (mycobilin-producing)
VIAVVHLRLPDADQPLADATALLGALGHRDGFVSGSLGRAMDDPSEWVLVTSWADVGSYRRGLSAYEVKLAFAPVMPYVRDEVSAYEIVSAR